MQQKVLVTGANGFIGRHTLLPLVECGFEVHAAYIGKTCESDTSVTWHEADLLIPGSASNLLQKIRPSHLLHFAWDVTPGKYWTSESNLDWVRASIHLAQLFYTLGGQRMVGAGTCAEYDWDYGYFREDLTPIAPKTLYGASKNSVNSILSAYAESNNCSFAWGRVFFPYGPSENPERLVPYVITSLMKGVEAKCTHGNQVRDYMFVEDIARAFVVLLQSEKRLSVNIASGRPQRQSDMLKTIEEITGASGLLKLGAMSPNKEEPLVIIADVSVLQNELGFVPRYDIYSGLERTVEWYKDHLHIQ